ncbi:MAG: hypothetical protein H6Q36_256, partial [Chloroflexi bacterium]|nr:hypothetical protein [Chloroflexota bacterium]
MGEPETTVAGAALGVEDPELRPSPRWPVVVAGDPDLRPLADDLPSEPDPAPTPELEAEAHPVEDPVEAGRQIGRLEHHQERSSPAGEGKEPVQPVGCRRPVTTVTGLGPSVAEVEHEDVHRPGLEEGPGHLQAAHGIRRDKHHEPFELDPPRDRLHRVQAVRAINPGSDRPGRLGGGDRPERERGRAGRARPGDGDATRPGKASGPEDGVQLGEPAGDDPARLARYGVRPDRHERPERQPVDGRSRSDRQRPEDLGRRPRRGVAPALPEHGEGGRARVGGVHQDPYSRTNVLV